MMMTDEIKALGEVGAPALVKSISRPNSSSGARPPSRDGGRPPSRDGARPLSRQSSSGGIEVLPSTGVENSLENGFTVRSRPDSARSITPVKQVALPSIPRKSEKKEPASDYDYHNEQKVNLKMSKAGRQSHDARNPENQGKLIKPIEEMDLNDGDIPVGPGGDQFGPNDEDSNDDDGDEDETSSEEVEDDDDDEPVKAPTELIMEFLHFVMNEEFENAQKLCKLILVYEPDNKEANTFLPLIEEKLQLDEENSDNSDSDEDSGDDDDEDDDGESDNQEEDSDVSGSSSEESSSNEEDSDEDNDKAKEEGDENRELTKNN
ncbi:uncharacterized protein LOC141907112 isoform X2 [Tubulanus polymorphus]|uniref:uncharacterized protein LOC141907112 isoform X2 n=1 Tax=Tubulanus polymorphus TaxID=672921 RepID=UPI003DA6B65E